MGLFSETAEEMAQESYERGYEDGLIASKYIGPAILSSEESERVYNKGFTDGYNKARKANKESIQLTVSLDTDTIKVLLDISEKSNTSIADVIQDLVKKLY